MNPKIITLLFKNRTGNPVCRCSGEDHTDTRPLGGQPEWNSRGAAGHSQNRRRMRRLLPPFIGCRSQRQKEETAHAQAIAAFYRLPQSAPEGGDGACAGIAAFCRLPQSAPEGGHGACAGYCRLV